MNEPYRWYRWKDNDTGLWWHSCGPLKASGNTAREAYDALMSAIASTGTPPAPETKPPSPAGTRRK